MLFHGDLSKGNFFSLLSQINTHAAYFRSFFHCPVISVSVYQAGDPGSRPARSACISRVEFYHCVIHSFPPVPATGSKKAVHVLLCLCNSACKRSLAICRKSRALCPVSRLLSVPIWPACVKNRDVNMIQTNKQTNMVYIQVVLFEYIMIFAKIVF